jgi:hypothetical protein
LGRAYLKMKNKSGARDEYQILQRLNSQWADKLQKLIK